MCDKRRYKSEKAADAGLHACEIQASRGFGRRAESRHYYCGKCFGWHLTSAEKRTG